MSLAEHFTRPPTKKLYKTDLTEEQWNKIEPLFPELPFSVRPRIHRQWLVSAMFYIKKTGCQWDLLPHDFPHYKTVHFYWSKWNRSGLFKEITAALQAEEREAVGKDPTPNALVLDSRSTKVIAKKVIPQ